MSKKIYPIHIPKEHLDGSSEAVVMKEIKAFLVKMKSCFYRIEGSGKIMRGQFIPSESAGLPDILIFVEGTSIGVEVKKRIRGATLSDVQAKVLCSMIGTHNRAGVVISVNGLVRMCANQEPDQLILTDWGTVPVYY